MVFSCGRCGRGRYGLWPIWYRPYWDDFSPSRMRQLAWWLDPAGQTISHQSCDGCTGCLWGDVSSLSWLCHTQVAEWFNTSLLVWWLSACLRCQPPSASFIWCFHLCAGVPRTHTGFGDRPFQVAGPRLWNSLPASLRQPDTTVGQFKKLLKTHLFSWDCGALVTVVFTAPCINISTTTTTTRPTTYALAALVKLIHTLMHAVSGVFKSSVKRGEVP